MNDRYTTYDRDQDDFVDTGEWEDWDEWEDSDEYDSNYGEHYDQYEDEGYRDHGDSLDASSWMR